jgi:hypothetical protein
VANKRLPDVNVVLQNQLQTKIAQRLPQGRQILTNHNQSQTPVEQLELRTVPTPSIFRGSRGYHFCSVTVLPSPDTVNTTSSLEGARAVLADGVVPCKCSATMPTKGMRTWPSVTWPTARECLTCARTTLPVNSISHHHQNEDTRTLNNSPYTTCESTSLEMVKLSFHTFHNDG